jgi:ribosomal protein S18 acetylase RimI-like enzyme
VSSIRKATVGDVAVLATTYRRAFADDPVLRWLMPADDEYETDGRRVFDFVVRRWLAQDSLWCTDDGVAAAGWNPPGRPEVDVDDIEPVDHPDWRVERLAALRACLVANTPEELHWHLNMIATHPDWQRLGLGAALMRTVFEIADAAGLPCYLETETPQNVAYYRHHGFEVRSEWDVSTDDSEGPHMWGMLRAAR